MKKMKTFNRIYARQAETDKNGVLINCCCPGYVKTDMTNHNERATKNTEEGSKTSVWLAMIPPGQAGLGLKIFHCRFFLNFEKTYSSSN